MDDEEALYEMVKKTLDGKGVLAQIRVRRATGCNTGHLAFGFQILCLDDTAPSLLGCSSRDRRGPARIIVLDARPGSARDFIS